MSTNTHINDEEETNSRLGCVKQYRDIEQDQDHTHTIPKIAKVLPLHYIHLSSRARSIVLSYGLIEWERFHFVHQQVVLLLF